MTKKMKTIISKIEDNKFYSLEEAASLVKKISLTKFDGSVDLAIKLGIDPKKTDQLVRGVVSLPYGTGKNIKVLALVTENKEKEAKDAGADFIGLDEFINKIKSGWTGIDVIVTMPSIMVKLVPLGRILGPRGLMPNPKIGTVTFDIGKSISEIKKGKINFKSDKYGIIHARIGKISFEEDKIKQNAYELISTLIKLKPTASKGAYLKSIYLSPTMGPSIPINIKNI